MSQAPDTNSCCSSSNIQLEAGNALNLLILAVAAGDSASCSSLRDYDERLVTVFWKRGLRSERRFPVELSVTISARASSTAGLPSDHNLSEAQAILRIPGADVTG